MGIYADGEVMYQPDYNNIVAAIKGDGVVDGEEVTATDPSSMNIVVGSGSHYISQTKYNINEQQLTISESDPTYDRLDIVVAGTGGPSVVTGTPAEKPKPPAIPSNSILLAIVRVPAGATAITNSNIYDRRIFVTMDAIQDRVKKSGDTMSGSLTGVTTLEADLLQVGGTEVISSSRVLKNVTGDGNVISSLNADLLDGKHASAFPLGGWELVDEASGSSAGTVEFTDLDGATDKFYMLFFWFSGGSVNYFQMRFGYGSAPTWDSSNNYKFIRVYGNTGGVQESHYENDNKINIVSPGEVNAGAIYIFCPNATEPKAVRISGYTTKYLETFAIGAQWNKNENLTGIKFLGDYGAVNWNAYHFTLWKRKP